MIYLGGHALLVSACLVEVLQLKSFVRENTHETPVQCKCIQFTASSEPKFHPRFRGNDSGEKTIH